MRHPEMRRQRFRLGGNEFVECRLRPADEALRWLAAHHLSLLRRVVTGLGDGPLVLDDVLRGEHHDVTGDVETRPPGPARDLMELARGRSLDGSGLTVDEFETACREVFFIESAREIAGSGRVLYLLRRRAE